MAFGKPIDIDVITARISFDQRYSVLSDGCWKWSGYINQRGYGVLVKNRKTYLAHRISYFVFHDINPGPFLVCHHCDFTSCVNPAHLFLGTDADNSTDKKNKGRASRLLGADNPTSRLTDENVLEIRRRAHVDPRISRTDLAAEFGVSHGTISHIIIGRVRLHLVPPGYVFEGKRHKGVHKPSPGEKNPRAKLSNCQAMEIRQKFLSGNHSKKSLSDEYGVCSSSISNIIFGRTFSEVGV